MVKILKYQILKYSFIRRITAEYDYTLVSASKIKSNYKITEILGSTKLSHKSSNVLAYMQILMKFLYYSNY